MRQFIYFKKSKNLILQLVMVVLFTLVLTMAGCTGEKALTGSKTAASNTLQTWVPTGQFASSSLIRVPKYPGELREAGNDQTLTLHVVRNEQASAQLAVQGSRDITNLQVEVSDLTTPNGTEIDAQKVQVRYAKYIPLEKKNPQVGGAVMKDIASRRAISGDNLGVIADPLREAKSVDVSANQAQPIWFTFHIPRTAQPGVYQGNISIQTDTYQTVTYDLTITVHDVVVPDPQDYQFHLDIWMNPNAIAEVYDVELWSDAHWALIKKYFTTLANSGQNTVTTTIIQNPWLVSWNDWKPQTAIGYDTMVRWKYDGENWSFDYTIFDRYVRTAFEMGVGPYITAYSLLAFRGLQRITYLDERTGEIVTKKMKVDTPFWKEAWTAFLNDFSAHLKKKGWLERTYLAFDERPADILTPVIELLREVAPTFLNQTQMAGSREVDKYAQNLSLNLDDLQQVSTQWIDRRREEGKTTTFYTWAGDNHPNMLTFSPAVEARMIPWISADHHLDGYLRWAFNSWPRHVFTNPVYAFSQGDEYMIYPGEAGPMSSIRWELLKEGIEDYELVRMLREKDPDNEVLHKAIGLVTQHWDGRKLDVHNLVKARRMIVEELERLSVEGEVAYRSDDFKMFASISPKNLLNDKLVGTANVMRKDGFGFRIPSLLRAATPNPDDRDVLLAFSHIGNESADWGNLDIAFRRSTDNGKTWSPVKTMIDMASNNAPQDFDDWGSAFYIDMATVQAENGDVVMLVDMYPESKGLHAPTWLEEGDGFKTIDGEPYLLLYSGDSKVGDGTISHRGEAFTVREHGWIYNSENEKTNYYIPQHHSAEYNYETMGDMYYAVGKADYLKKKPPLIPDNPEGDTEGSNDVYVGNIYLSYHKPAFDPDDPVFVQKKRVGPHKEGKLYSKYPDVITDPAPLRAVVTSYLWVTRSRDYGKTWSQPEPINPKVKRPSDGAFFGVGPGTGIVLQYQDEASKNGRIIMPAYSLKEGAAIYSDDNGFTWQRATSSTEGYINNIGEIQFVELVDGTILSFGRQRNKGKTPVSVSRNGGETWSRRRYTNLISVHSQKSVIAYPFDSNTAKDATDDPRFDYPPGLQKGKQYVLSSHPTGGPHDRPRSHGVIELGVVQPNHTIKWIAQRSLELMPNPYSKTQGNEDFFAYSSLAVLENGDIGVLFEPQPNNYIAYASFNLEWVLDDKTKPLDSTPKAETGIAATPPMGWNSWNYFRCYDISEQVVKEVARAMVETGMKAAGYEYIVVDDCWQALQRDKNGNLQSNPERYPSGIEALADYVHSLGLKLGLYASPGSETCAMYWDDYPGENLGSYGHVFQDAHQFADWGIDYLKYDWCRADETDGLERVAAFKKMREALEATGRSIYYSISEYGETQPWKWAPPIADMWRTTHDIRPNWSSLMRILDHQVGLYKYSEPGNWNDPDMLQVGNPGLSETENRAHFSLWAMLAAPLMAGNDLRNMSSSTIEILTNKAVIAIDQDPIGMQGRKVRDDGPYEVWMRPLANGDRAVLLLNRSKEEKEMTVQLAKLGVPAVKHSYTIRDLWAHTGSQTEGRIEAAVPSHGVKMYRVSPAHFAKASGEIRRIYKDGAKAVWVQQLHEGGVRVTFVNQGGQDVHYEVAVSKLNLPEADRYTIKNIWSHKTETTAKTVTATVASYDISVVEVEVIE